MTLRALFICLCALLLVTESAAGATASERGTPKQETRRSAPVSLEARLANNLDAVRRHRGTIRFFQKHPSLLRSATTREKARDVLRRAERRLAAARKAVAKLRRAISRREARRLASLPPRRAICDVFGSHCEAAIDVAWCESRLTTTARNGQYLGLFQMGSYERRLFGHGDTAYEQAKAAHRYFVLSGRDWSPWGCRWAAS
jgi:hypothetical protein